MIDNTVINELSAGLHVDQVSNPRNNSFIRASGIGDCRRKLYYRVKWYQEGISEESIWSHGLFTFDMGHGIHLQLQQRLSNAGALKWVDAEPSIDEKGRFGWKGNCEIDLINEEYRVAGHCDGLTKPLKRVRVDKDGDPFEVMEVTDEDDPDGKRYLLDIKSITARERVVIDSDPETGIIRKQEVKPSAFAKLVEPKPEHVQQAGLYAWLTTLPGFKTDRISAPLKEIPEVMIIYVAKDLDPQYYSKSTDFNLDNKLLYAPYKVFTTPVTPVMLEVIKRKLSVVWKHIDSGKPPPRDYNHTPARPAWACVDCPFRRDCYSKEGYFEDDIRNVPPLLSYKLKIGE